MKLNGVRIGLLIACIAAASCISCNNQGSKPVTATTAKPGPEESFSLIWDTFRRRMEETPVGFVTVDSGTRSLLTGSNKVSYELIRPTSPTENYKAVITVTTESKYSLRRTKDDLPEEQPDANANEDTTLKNPNDKNVGEVFDSGFKSTPQPDATKSRSTSPSTEDTVVQHPDKTERKCELVYENGRWKLITELNKDTEGALQNAFHDALATQI
jgi:hypothetical protein